MWAFGAPYCYQAYPHPNSVGDTRGFYPAGRSDGAAPASLGMRFYTGSQFPETYKNAIFVARHGSWNRSNKFGGDVVVVKLNKDGTVKSVEPFLTGFLENNNYVGRPVDVQPMKDGSLLISDDWNGAVYRVTYGKPRVAGR